MHAQFVDFPTPRNLNYLWTFGGILTFMLHGADRDRHRARHALPAERDGRLRFDRAHPPRRELRLADPQPARGRRLDVLPRRLHPHLPRPLLRLLQGAARGAVDHRRPDLRRDDGDRLHGLLAALGADELLGGHGHHQPVLLARQHHSGARHDDRRVAVGRLLGDGRDAQPLLQPALSAAVRDRGPGRPAPVGAAHRRPEQPHRARHQDRVGRGAVYALCDVEGCRSDCSPSCSCSPGSRSSCPTISATPTTTSRPIRW